MSAYQGALKPCIKGICSCLAVFDCGSKLGSKFRLGAINRIVKVTTRSFSSSRYCWWRRQLVDNYFVDALDPTGGFRSYLIRNLDCLTVANFMNWHAVEALKCRIDHRLEVGLPSGAKSACFVFQRLSFQGRDCAGHLLNDRAATFFGSSPIKLVQLESGILGVACLSGPNEVTSDNCSDRANSLDPGGEVTALLEIESEYLALVEDDEGAVNRVEQGQGYCKYSNNGKQQLESKFHNVPQDRRERKSYPDGGRAVLVDSRIAIQFFAGWGASKFGSELLAGLGSHNDEICRCGKLPCELQRIALRLSSRLRNSTDFFQRHIRNGKSSSNSVRRLAFQWNEVHQLFEADVNADAVKLFMHARQRWIIVIIKRGGNANGAELLPKAMELWRQMCRIEGRHSDSIALPSTRFSAGDQQSDCGSKECRDSRRPSSRRWVGDELSKWGREYRSECYHYGYCAKCHGPAAPVEPFSNRFVHRGFLPSWWVGASYSTQWRLSA